MRYASRNDALGFAHRSRKNLAFIEKAYSDNADVHVVTQLVLSMLGLVIFPMERNLVARLEKLTLQDLDSRGWPSWTVELGTCGTLEELARHIRNAVAHGHIAFDSDDRDIANVRVRIEDFKPKGNRPYWRGSIAAIDLRSFCYRFIELIEQTIG